MSAVHSGAENLEHRKQLLLNLMEEEAGEVNHPELWLRFADALGSSREESSTAACFAETQNLIDTLRAETRNGDTLEGISALYGYESQIPEISHTKIEGLTQHYGVTSDAGLSFFRVHEEADVLHRQAERDVISDLITSAQDEERAIRSAQRVAKAFYGMLDGIVRECGVECGM